MSFKNAARKTSREGGGKHPPCGLGLNVEQGPRHDRQ